MQLEVKPVLDGCFLVDNKVEEVLESDSQIRLSDSRFTK